VSGGTFRTHSGLRATINAWLENISFRTGMITGAVVLLAIAAAGAGERIGAGRGGFGCRPGGLRAGQSRRLAARVPAALGRPAMGVGSRPRRSALRRSVVVTSAVSAAAGQGFRLFRAPWPVTARVRKTASARS
jgi:hypothetical protein